MRIAGPRQVLCKRNGLITGKNSAWYSRKPWRFNEQFEPFEVAKVAGTLMQVFGAERLNGCLQGQEQLTLSKSGDLKVWYAILAMTVAVAYDVELWRLKSGFRFHNR